MSPMTGQKLTDRLQKLMSETGYSFTTPVERKLLDRIKVRIAISQLNFYPTSANLEIRPIYLQFINLNYTEASSIHEYVSIKRR